MSLKRSKVLLRAVQKLKRNKNLIQAKIISVFKILLKQRKVKMNLHLSLKVIKILLKFIILNIDK